MALQSGWLDLDHSGNTTTTLSEHELMLQSLQLLSEAKIRLIQRLATSLAQQDQA